MAKEKDNKIPNFAEYERKRLLELARQARKTVLKLKKMKSPGTEQREMPETFWMTRRKKPKNRERLKRYGVFFRRPGTKPERISRSQSGLRWESRFCRVKSLLPEPAVRFAAGAGQWYGRRSGKVFWRCGFGDYSQKAV